MFAANACAEDCVHFRLLGVMSDFCPTCFRPFNGPEQEARRATIREDA
jgi:hypothetical protein